MNCSVENVPNMVAMNSQVSSSSLRYQDTQFDTIPGAMEVLGADVILGSNGAREGEKAAMQ